jgi:hypothetical protein
MTPIDRYKPGGDIYQTLSDHYGSTAAQKVYQAALGGQPGAIAQAIGEVRNGPPLNDSTASIFLDQIETDPLAAPLASANSLIGNSVLSFLKNPMVLLAVGVGLFFWLGGANLIRAWFKKRG